MLLFLLNWKGLFSWWLWCSRFWNFGFLWNLKKSASGRLFYWKKTELEYAGNACHFWFKKNAFLAEEINVSINKYKRPKIMYIPSERNVLSVVKNIEHWRTRKPSGNDSSFKKKIFAGEWEFKLVTSYLAAKSELERFMTSGISKSVSNEILCRNNNGFE